MAELHRQLSRIETGRTGRTSASAYNPKSDNFELERYLKQVFREREEAGLLAREATVVFEDLCVDGVGSGVNFGETVGSIFGAPLRGGGKAPVKYILQNFTGAVKSGEMLLVLGRPGSGCTSFLKTLGNQTASFSEVRGDLSYSGITPAEMLAHHAGDVAYLAEDDKHLPILTVDQTL
jgi:ATP-binding cassette subfamily G (WHITE) protein 2 (SNQ2)